MQTRARARAGEYHLALGPPTRDATRATKASMQTRASLLKARAGVYFLAMQTRASLWRARAGVCILDVGPLTQAARASMQTRASSWRVRARAASPNTSPKPRGAQWQPKSGRPKDLG